MSSILKKLGLRKKHTGGAESPETDQQEQDRRHGPLFRDHRSDTNPIRSEYAGTRLTVVMLAGSCVMNVILGLAIIEMIPLRQVMPYFVTFSDESNQIVSIAPPTRRMSSMSIILEQQIKEYMTMRYTITGDKTSNAYRWNTRIPIMSSRTVLSEFQTELAQDHALEGTGDGAAVQTTRTITIQSINRLRPFTYQINFDLFTHQTGSGLSDSTDRESHWTAIIQATFLSQRIPRDAMALNPFGFTITQYSVAPRNNTH